MTPLQTSIIATMDEIIQAQDRLGVPADEDDMAEAWYIIEQLETQWAKRNEPTA
jgi:hypothetical protein